MHRVRNLSNDKRRAYHRSWNEWKKCPDLAIPPLSTLAATREWVKLRCSNMHFKFKLLTYLTRHSASSNGLLPPPGPSSKSSLLTPRLNVLQVDRAPPNSPMGDRLTMPPQGVSLKKNERKEDADTTTFCQFHPF